MTPLAASSVAGFTGMFTFIAIFAVVVYLLVRKGAKAEAEQHAKIIFNEEEPHG